MLAVVVGILSKAVLVLLVGLSVWSIAIIRDRTGALRGLQSGDRAVLMQCLKDTGPEAQSKFEQALGRSTGLLAGTLRSAQTVVQQKGGTEQMDRSIRAYLQEERTQMEKGLTLLATIGSNAPFVGLFGTVLGIIQAFSALSGSGAGTGAGEVMGGVSEALIATAVGIFVAIPAIVYFNILSRTIRELISECEVARDRFVANSALCVLHMPSVPQGDR